jgi:putative hydrolase of the HAD superfamily
MNINTILFDLDDTLIEEENSAKTAFYKVCEIVEMNHKVDKDLFYKEIRVKSRELWHTCPERQYCLDVGISSWEGLWAEFTGTDTRLLNLHKWKKYYHVEAWIRALKSFGIDDNGFAFECSNIFREERKKINIVFPEVLRCLKELKKNYRLGLVTNGVPDLQWYKIKKAGLEDFFKKVIISGEHGIGKPHVKIFREALTQLCSSVDETVMVGDNLNSDISGAQNMSMKSIWINRFSKELKEGIKPDFQITNIQELKGIIESISN